MPRITGIITGLKRKLDSVYDLEWIAFLLLLIGSIDVLNPYTDVFSNSRSYELIEMAMSENTFGAIFLFIALLSLFSILNGGIRFRRNVLAVQTVFWILMFAAFLSANLATFFPWFTSVFVLISAIPLKRLSELAPWIRQ